MNGETGYIDLTEVENSLSDSKCHMEECARKESVLTEAIDILESNDIPVPESIYGLRDAYNAQVNLERNYYERLMALVTKMKNDKGNQTL